MADDHLFQPGREKTGGRKLGVRNKLSERFLRDLHSEWERSGEATLKILAKENPEAFARLAVGCLPKEFEGLPPPVTIITGVLRGDEQVAIAMPSMAAVPQLLEPEPATSSTNFQLEGEAAPAAKEPEFVKAGRAKAEPAKAEPIPYPPLPEWR